MSKALTSEPSLGTHLSLTPRYGLPRFTAQMRAFFRSLTFQTVLNSPFPIGSSMTYSRSKRETPLGVTGRDGF